MSHFIKLMHPRWKKTLKTLEKQQFSPTFHEFYLFGELLLGK